MKSKFFLGLGILMFIFFCGCQQEDISTGNSEDVPVPESTHKTTGAESQLLTGEDAGLPLKSLPGVRTITMDEFLILKEIPETGLYLIDMNFVPQELEDELKTAGYMLHKDGTLDSSGTKITLFVKTEVYQLNNKKSLPTSTTDVDSRGNPLPFTAYSWSFWWKYDGGFCRKYRAHTKAYAYGPKTGNFRPYTNIQTIQTHVNGNEDICRGCYQESSKWRWKIGCFWPAHGGASGYHHFYMYDRGISIFKTWRWGS